MGALLGLAVGLVAACGGGGPPQPGPPPQALPAVLTLDTAAAYPWQGWGTSLAWWANTVGDASASPGAPTATAATPAARPGSCPGTAGRTEVCDAGWPAAARAQVLTDLFGNPQPTASGKAVDPLGLNVLRYNLGASPWDLSTLPSSCGGGPEAPLGDNGTTDRFGYGKAVPAVEQGPGAPIELNWDAAQLSVLRAATADIRQQASALPVLQAFANSPPWWMLADQCPAGGGADSRVDPTRYADYLASVLGQYQRAGIDFSTVEPFNEPHLGIGSAGKFWSGCTNSCQEGASFTLADQQRVVDALCPALSAAGDNGVKAAVDDDNTPDLTDAQIRLLGSESCVGQVDTHGYDGGVGPYLGAGRATLSQDVPAADSLWMSEFGSSDAGTLATQIADDLQELRPSAWVLWQAVDPSWGLFTGLPSEPPPGSAAQVTINASFQAFGQYTRYLRPGSRIVPLELAPGAYDNPGDAPRATVAVDPSGQVVVVTTNPGTGAQGLQLDLRPLHPATSGATHQLSLGSTTVTDTDTPPTLTSGGQLDVTLPGRTVTTYVFGPAGAPPSPVTTTTTAPATTTTTAPPTTTTTATTPPLTTATPTLTHEQFVADANQVCRQASAQIPAASDPFDLASIAATLRADQAVLPQFLQQEQTLVATQPDRAGLDADWLRPMQQDLTAASPLIQQFLSDYDSGQMAAAEQVVEEISAAPDHRDTIVAHLQSYGLTDCAALEEK
jgi:hypothetical protein